MSTLSTGSEASFATVSFGARPVRVPSEEDDSRNWRRHRRHHLFSRSVSSTNLCRFIREVESRLSWLVQVQEHP